MPKFIYSNKFYYNKSKKSVKRQQLIYV